MLQVAAADPEGARGDVEDYRVEVIAGESRTRVEVDGHDAALAVAGRFVRAYDDRAGNDRADDERPGALLRSVADRPS